MSADPGVRVCFCRLLPENLNKFPRHGILDYIYGMWWKCRNCGMWHESKV